MVALFITLSLLVGAQIPVIKSVDMPEEIQQTSITCLYQDANNYMWIGTSKGLFGFDGIKFQSFKPHNSSSNLQVSALYMDHKKTLWVGTKKGQIFTLSSDSLQAFNPEEGVPSVAITGFETDLNHNLWISTYGEGLYCYSNRRLYSLNMEDGLSENYCYTIKKDKYGRIWAATDGGISVCSFYKKRKSIRVISSGNGLPDNIVLSLGMQGNTMWVGMQDAGICSIEISTLKVNSPPQPYSQNLGPIKNLLVGKNWLWMTGERTGIITFNTETQQYKDSIFTLEKNLNVGIQSMLFDNQGNYWIAAGSRLYMSLGTEVLHYKKQDAALANNIHSVLADRHNNIWFGSDAGLSKRNLLTGKETLVKLPLIDHTHIISLYEDNNGIVWAGTFGKGLIAIEPISLKTRLFGEKEGLLNGNILAIAGNEKKLWLATLGGAYECDIHTEIFSNKNDITFVNYSEQHFPGNNYIYDVLVDSKGRVWYATDGKGVSMLQNARFTHFNQSNGLKSNIIYSMVEDGKGNIWFSSSNDGLYKYSNGRFTNYTLSSGLSEMQITGLLADKNHLVIVHNNGVDIMDVSTGNFFYYGAAAGFADIKPDLNACGLSKEGVAWIGTQNGLIRIEMPTEINSRQPQVQVNKLSVFLGPENFLGIHDFKYNRNHISFHFLAYWYQSPGAVRFQIKLDGYDRDWIETRNNLITYADLKPGEYTFHVRATLTGNFETAHIESYSFRISKPFWKTYWFIILSAILIASLIYTLIYMRDISIRKREAAGREKILFQLQTLRSQVNPHFLFNSFSTLITIIDEDKEIAIEYVEKLSDFFRNILEYKDKDLIPLHEELMLIDTYTYLQKKRFCENLNIFIDKSTVTDTMLIPPMVLQMLIENAVKHNVVSAGHPLRIDVTIDSGKISISNTLQPKKIAVPSTGIGLENIRNRYKLLGHSDIEIHEENGKYTVIIPIIYG